MRRSPLAATVLGSSGSSTPSAERAAAVKAASPGSPRRFTWPTGGYSTARWTPLWSRASAILSRAFLVEEDRLGDGRAQHAPADERHLHLLAHAPAPVLHQREGDRAVEEGAEVARGHVAQHRHRRRHARID